MTLVSLVVNISYRGYYYDTETGLYYLQSRYYDDPEMGRFINLDDTNIALLTVGEIEGANLFAYCDNNPINFVDYLGFWYSETQYRTDSNPKFPNFIEPNDEFYYIKGSKPSVSDKVSFKAYKLAAEVAFVGLPNGAKFFKHFMGATGKDLKYDYSVAIRNDESIKKTIYYELRLVATTAESYGSKSDYFLLGDRYFYVECKSLDWSFAIGGHRAIILAQVIYDRKTSKYSVAIIIQAVDYYNFSKTRKFLNIAKVTKPGRFIELGWAKNFYSYGVTIYRLTWVKGSYNSTFILLNNTPKIDG